MSNYELKLSSSKFKLYHDDELYEHHENQIVIYSNSYLVLIKGGYGNIYTKFDEIKPKDRPYLYLDDKQKSLDYGRFKIIFVGLKDYNTFKKYLSSYQTKK